jgi:hypothetical protein
MEVLIVFIDYKLAQFEDTHLTFPFSYHQERYFLTPGEAVAEMYPFLQGCFTIPKT